MQILVKQFALQTSYRSDYQSNSILEHQWHNDRLLFMNFWKYDELAQIKRITKVFTMLAIILFVMYRFGFSEDIYIYH